MSKPALKYICAIADMARHVVPTECEYDTTTKLINFINSILIEEGESEKFRFSNLFL